MTATSWRNTLLAHRCSARGQAVIGTAAPEAALIGRDVLRAGGNIFDAVVAAAMAETVLMPSKCGLAGDLVALVRPAGAPLRALIAIGGAAAGLAEAVADRPLPVVGGLSVGVPGAPRGYAALASLGRLPMRDLVTPAISVAKNGFAWSPLSQHYAEKASAVLLRENPEGTVYLPQGTPMPAGTWTRLPGLAEVLEQFAALGGELYSGQLGEELVRAVAARDGVLTMDDLSATRAEWISPEHRRIDSVDFWVTPSPTHGPALLGALGAPLRRSGNVGDQIQRVRAARERQRACAGDPTGDGGTSIITGADAEGNLVVLVHSLSHPTFGSGIVVPDYDLVLGNRAGRGFTAQPGHPNFPVPGRRPLTTLHAWALSRSPTGLIAGATSGGAQQMPWNLQVIERLIAECEPTEAVLSPLWALDPVSDRLTVEPGLSAHDSAPLDEFEQLAGVQLVHQNDDDVCHVVSDIRSVGGVAAI